MKPKNKSLSLRDFNHYGPREFMYLAFYHLKEKPFQITTDPRFLWLGEKHEEALATLRYGILDNKGFLLLTGDVGTGKTTLINSLLKSLEKNTLVASIRDPALDPLDFYNYTAHAFGMEGSYTSKGSFFIHFERFLHQANRAGKNVLLIIDEAQRINQEMLEEVRLFSNIEKEDRKLLNIFFIGQIEFNDILLRHENRAIRQRITVNYHIPTLTRKETEEYIRHRLKIAGSEAEIFEEKAIDEIFSFSRGYPRLINITCDRSLLTGFVEESGTITHAHVKECVQELTIPPSRTYGYTPRKEAAQPAAVSNVSHAKRLGRAKPGVTVSVGKPSARHTRHLARYTKYTEEDPDQSPGNKKRRKPESILTLFYKILGIGIILSVIIFADPLVATRDSNNKKLAHSHFRQAEQFLMAKEYTKAKQAMNEASSTLDRIYPEIDIIEHLMGEAETLENSGNIEEALLFYEQAEETARQIGFDEQGKAIRLTMDSLLLKKGLIEARNAAADKIQSAAKPAKAAEQIIQLPGETQEVPEKLVISFPSNSNFPPVKSLDEINRLVDYLTKQPEQKIKITGFSDSMGNEGYNRNLSEFRANSVKSYLMGKGLEASRITISGLGSENPVATNDTPAGRMANRRVEIEVTP
ncbi:MAG: AAA family ATPase [Desulfobulbaceae bacterium]|nr:AAA family ATPase [Desulfobulbaceae bacterium]